MRSSFLIVCTLSSTGQCAGMSSTWHLVWRITFIAIGTDTLLAYRVQNLPRYADEVGLHRPLLEIPGLG